MKVVIVGASEVGFHIASRLAHENKDVAVIDIEPEAIRRVSDSIKVQVITGSGSSPVVLTETGIREAQILLAVANSDDTDLAACFVADTEGPARCGEARPRHGLGQNGRRSILKQVICHCHSQPGSTRRPQV